MKNRVFSGRRFAVSMLVMGAALLAAAPLQANGKKKSAGGSPAGSATAYSGQAVALRIDGVLEPVPGPIVVCDTGLLPASGGLIEKSEVDFSYGNGALTIEQAAAQVSGIGPEAAAESTLTGYRVEFVVQDGDHVHRALIEADYIHAEVAASVGRKGAIALSSKVEIRNLRVNGQAIAVTGAANQRVDLPKEVGGWLIINDQASAGGTVDGDIGVSAIHFFVCHCIEGHVGFVTAGITPGSKPPPPEDGNCGKLTGGGWIVGTPSGHKATFGVSGGIRRGSYWGHLTYSDHGAKLKVKSTRVTGFEVDPTAATGRIIKYDVTINGAVGTAVVRVVDKGEPGRNDIFEISLSTGYRAAGDLGGARAGGGNIQLHKCPPGWE